MPLHFVPVGEAEGFHSAGPPLLAVGLSGMSLVAVRGAGGGLRVHCDNPSIAAVTPLGPAGVLAPGHPGDLLFQIDGVGTGGMKTGKANVVATQGPEWAHLRIRVLPPLTVYANFYFVTDKNHTTERSPSSLQTLLDSVNTIHTPQNNITFKSHIVGYRDMPLDFSSEMVKHEQKKFWRELQDNVSWGEEVNMNVLFVREWKGRDHHADHWNVLATTHLYCIVMEDDTGSSPDHIVLAHEAGHYLGRHGHHGAEQADLMHYTSVHKGIRIRWWEVKRMRATAAMAG